MNSQSTKEKSSLVAFLASGRGIVKGEKKSSRGFILAPMLYALVLVGVGASVLFSSYTQILRSGAQLTNSVTVKNDLNATASTLSALTATDTIDGILCPPGGSGASAGCTTSTGYTSGLAAFSAATASQLPSGCTTSGCAGFTTGSPKEMGLMQSSLGVKQLDAWGHNYIYCRWESTLAVPNNPAFTIISAGQNGILETGCANITPNGDDQLTYVTVSNAIAKASTWQQTATGAVYGSTASGQIKADANGTLESMNLKLGALTGYMYANGSNLVTASTDIPAMALSGTLQAAQMPALTGDVTTNTGSLTASVAKIQGQSVGTPTGTGNIVFSVSPTFAGTLAGVNALFSGTVTGNLAGRLAGTSIGGATGTGNVVFSASPTFTGTVNGATAIFSGNVTASNFIGNVSGSAGSISAGNITGTLGIANGGTGLSVLGVNGACLQSNGSSLVYASCGGALGTPPTCTGSNQTLHWSGSSWSCDTIVPTCGGGYVLTYSGSAYVCVNIISSASSATNATYATSAGSASTATSATTASSLSGALTTANMPTGMVYLSTNNATQTSCPSGFTMRTTSASSSCGIDCSVTITIPYCYKN